MRTEVVTREEVEKEVEYLVEGAKNLANFYTRAHSQGAPMSLLNEMSAVWIDLEKARKRLQAIIPCFPPEGPTT